MRIEPQGLTGQGVFRLAASRGSASWGADVLEGFRFRRSLLIEHGCQDDVHPHLKELGLPVLERRLDEVSGRQVLQHRNLFGRPVLELFLVVGRRTGSDHADEGEGEQTDTCEEQSVLTDDVVQRPAS